jgi:DNA (cytosine-5)-methyltransferase 1
MRAVDYFAGAGGFTLGAELAGAEVVTAINHWPLAVQTHRANHPRIEHRCEDLTRFDPSKLPAFDLLLASPACQGHSRGRGVARGSEGDRAWDASRATAWAVVDCLEVRRPRALVVENVLDFARWELFPVWCEALRRLGYAPRAQVCDASAFGVPQERPRLIITAVRGREAPVVVPPKGARQVPASEVVDLATGSWSPVEREGRAAATLARVIRGRQEVGPRFVMPYYGGGSGLTGRSLARPLGTVTTRDRWALVDGDRMRMLTVSEYRAVMGFPEGYQLPRARHEAIHLLGNAICPPVAAAAVRAVMEVCCG